MSETLIEYPTISADKIKILVGWNKRTDFGEIEELLASIVENGLERPLRGYFEGEEFIPTDGHRRQLAIKLGLENKVDLPPIKIEPFDPAKVSPEERALHQVTLNDSKPLNPLEFANWCAWMQEEFGYDVRKLSKKTGKSKNKCHKALIVGTSDPRIREFIRNGTLSFTNATKIIAAYPDNPEAQIAEITGAVSSSTEIEDQTEIVAPVKRITKKDIKVVAEKTPLLKLKALLDKVEIDRVTGCKDFSNGTLLVLGLINDLCFGRETTEKVYVKLKFNNK